MRIHTFFCIFLFVVISGCDKQPLSSLVPFHLQDVAQVPVKVLAGMLQNYDRRVRLRAMSVIVRERYKEAAVRTRIPPYLIPGVATSNHLEQLLAITALRKIGPPHAAVAIPALQRTLLRGEPTIQQEAFFTLEVLGAVPPARYFY